jgi:Flp pilus assembly protein TadD
MSACGRLKAASVVGVCAAGVLAGCASGPTSELSSGFLGLSFPASTDDGKPKSLPELAKAHAENPADTNTTVAYARGLKAGGKAKDALGVIEIAASKAPDNQQLVVEQGLLALELGQPAKAQHALMRASPNNTDWKILSGIGVAHSGLGQHKEAQKYLEKALALAPENPTVLNNLALSYILDKKVDKGRELLQRAAAAGGNKPQIARNLELAMALKGGSKPKPAAKPAAAEPAATPAEKPEMPPPAAKPEPAEPPATASAPAPATATGPKKTAALDQPVVDAPATVIKTAADPVKPKMLNLGGPLADR